MATLHAPRLEEWRLIRELVEDIHIDQGLTLCATVARLRREGYLVSEKMIKTRMKGEWHIGKYNTEQGMKAVLRKARERDAQGKQSNFALRGRTVTLEDVARHFSRKGLTLDDVVVSPRATPPGLAVTTPRTSPGPSEQSPAVTLPRDMHRRLAARVTSRIPSPVQDPPADLSRSNLLRSIQRYYGAKFSSGQWILATIQSDISTLYPSKDLGAMFNQYDSLRILGKHGESWGCLQRAFEMVQPLLLTQDPRLLTYLLESIAFNQLKGYDELAVAILRHFAQMSKVILGQGHPITIFSACLWLAESTDRPYLLELALQCMFDQFQTHIGPTHVETMRLMLTSSQILKHQRNFAAARQFLDQLQGRFELVYGHNSYQACHSLADRAHIQILLGEFDDAFDLLQGALLRAWAITEIQESTESVVRCHMTFATLADAENQPDVRLLHLHNALAATDGLLDEMHWMVLWVKSELAAAEQL